MAEVIRAAYDAVLPAVSRDPAVALRIAARMAKRNEPPWQVRVYYEDTDLAGIVYYANYLRFIERARTEWVRALGVDQGQLKAETGVVFAVRRIEADYLAPARFDDVLTIETDVRDVGARASWWARRCEGRMSVCSPPSSRWWRSARTGVQRGFRRTSARGRGHKSRKSDPERQWCWISLPG